MNSSSHMHHSLYNRCCFSSHLWHMQDFWSAVHCALHSGQHRVRQQPLWDHLFRPLSERLFYMWSRIYFSFHSRKAALHSDQNPHSVFTFQMLYQISCIEQSSDASTFWNTGISDISRVCWTVFPFYTEKLKRCSHFTQCVVNDTIARLLHGRAGR